MFGIGRCCALAARYSYLVARGDSYSVTVAILNDILAFSKK